MSGEWFSGPQQGWLYCADTTGTCEFPYCLPLIKKESTSDSHGISQIAIRSDRCGFYSDKIYHALGIRLGCAYRWGGDDLFHQPRDTCGEYRSDGDWVNTLQEAANAFLESGEHRVDLAYYCYSYYCYGFCDAGRTECCCSCDYYKHTYVRMYNCEATLRYFEEWIESLPDPPTVSPSLNPTSEPSDAGANLATLKPTEGSMPMREPTFEPITIAPIPEPTQIPTFKPTITGPISEQTGVPTFEPSKVPTPEPTHAPSTPLSATPSASPSHAASTAIFRQFPSGSAGTTLLPVSSKLVALAECALFRAQLSPWTFSIATHFVISFVVSGLCCGLF